MSNDAAELSKIHKRNVDDKQVFALLKFQTASENFDSGKGNDSDLISPPLARADEQDYV